MNLYLDDDSTDAVLVALLRNSGHDVQLPSEVGISSAADHVHLTHSIRSGRALLTANDKDFRGLHHLIQEARGQHAGILVVRYDNDARRDLTPRGIVLAIEKFVAAAADVTNALTILNHWR